MQKMDFVLEYVAPFAGAWIEIAEPGRWKTAKAVAPFAGAWIEMTESTRLPKQPTVAPFAGAWIEITKAERNDTPLPSLPSRERGLKSLKNVQEGVLYRRSLRGSVD